jgi:hypothetical protein
MVKLDLKKDLKHLYRPSAKAVSAENVPAMNFLMIDGSGNPNTSWLSRRSLALLEELAKLGIYGEEAADVGARFVDQALKQFAQHDVQPEQSLEEQLSAVDSHGDYEGTINHVLSAQSLYLLHRIAELEIYGETSGEVGARFVDLALQGFVEPTRFVISRNRSK